MPYKIEFHEESQGVITTYWGIVNNDDILQSSNEKREQIDKIMHLRYALTDLSRVEKFNVTAEGIRHNAFSSLDVLDGNRKMIVAFVLNTQLEYGMGRVWQAYADGNAERSRFFKNRGEAEKWINEELDRNTDS